MSETYEAFVRANAARGGHEVTRDGEYLVITAADGRWCRHRLGGQAEREFYENRAAEAAAAAEAREPEEVKP